MSRGSSGSCPVIFDMHRLSLQTMERAAEASGGSGAPQLQFHNLVNNADIVPRLLGTSLDSLHGLLEAYVPMIQVWIVTS